MRHRSVWLCVLVCSMAAAQTVPDGFAVDTLATGLTMPTGMAFLPDGRLLVIEQQTGNILVWTGASVLPLIGTVPNVHVSGGEAGLLAIAVDPAWPARPYVYVWYDSTLSPHLYLSMITIVGDLTDPTSSGLSLGAIYHVLTGVPDQAPIHNGGSLRFGPDGYLYLSTGEDADECAAQDPNSGLGALLRLDVSGLPGVGAGPPPKSALVAAGNPFRSPVNGFAPLIWAHGFRNPFRFHIDPVTGRVFVADVGWFTMEEIDAIDVGPGLGGKNFGWPWVEGTVPANGCTGSAPQTVAPIFTIDHATGARAIMSAGPYRQIPFGIYSFGSNYDGDYFLSDYYTGLLERLKFNGASWSVAPAVPGQANPAAWATGFGLVPDALVGPDGALYFLKWVPGALGRIRSTTVPRTLAIVQGDGQTANAGRLCFDPLTVRLTLVNGAPATGEPVTFAVTSGGGALSATTVLTDAQGFATTTYTMAGGFAGPPSIVATAANAAPVTFNLVWRGLAVSYSAVTSEVTCTVFHSATNAPVTLVFDLPSPVPYFQTNYNDVWTNVLSPIPPLGAFDGLGLVGPSDPSVRTGAFAPLWTRTVTGLPPVGGITLRFQAYGVDTGLWPAETAFLISNVVDVTFN